MLKAIMISFGTISLVIGVLGAFVPGLPTTPFLLLSAGLYVHSSERLYNFLINNRYIGAYILKYRSNKGMTRKMKLYSICLMWLMIIISIPFFIHSLTTKIIVSFLGLIGTFVMGIIVPTSNTLYNNR
jgi:uncharacterized protein